RKISTTSPRFETMSKRRKGFPSETQVKRGVRVVHGEKELEERLGRNDPCPCGSGRRFKSCCRNSGCFRRRKPRPLLSESERRSLLDLGGRAGFCCQAHRRDRFQAQGRMKRREALSWQNPKKRVPENVAGDFFVDSTCIDCNTCRQIAPAVFGEALGTSFVKAQPAAMARNNRDWHHLIDLCAMTDTLVIDEDGIYDPRQINDRLLLGLKGSMAEFELGLLRQRAREALLQMIHRGVVLGEVAVGYVRTESRGIEMIPDRQV